MKKVLKTKEATIDSLSEKIDILTDTVDNLAAITAAGFAGVNARIDKVETRLSKIETTHGHRIDVLEDKNRILSTAFENKLKIKLPK